MIVFIFLFSFLFGSFIGAQLSRKSVGEACIFFKKWGENVGVNVAVPAGGVKGKTWGPSTCHQRERGQLPLIRATPRPGGIWSKSAPNLDKKTKPSQHDIGNSTSTPSQGKLQLFKNKVTTAFTGGYVRNNSLPTSNASLTPTSRVLVDQNRLSRSIGNISESHYDTVFINDSFVIRRAVDRSDPEIDRDYVDLHADTDKLLKD